MLCIMDSSALSQDEQDDAQLRIEDILQMVGKPQHTKCLYKKNNNESL